MKISALPEGVPAGSPGALERLDKRFELIWSPVKVGPVELQLPEFKDPTAYIEQRLDEGQGDGDQLPYWTKLWPAAFILAHFNSRMSGYDKEPVLELGAGLGLPGLVAAALGRPTLCTDLDPDALEFCRAAAERNGLGDLVRVLPLDWTKPPAGLGKFATVLGAEVLYHPPLYPQLVELLAGLLKPGGAAYISHQERPFGIEFFDLAKEKFEVRRNRSVLRGGDDGPTTVYIHALSLKGNTE
jgi:predicted nicotinamide N-methyase